MLLILSSSQTIERYFLRLLCVLPHRDITNLLGANVEAQNDGGMTSLMFAAKDGNQWRLCGDEFYDPTNSPPTPTDCNVGSALVLPVISFSCNNTLRHLLHFENSQPPFSNAMLHSFSLCFRRSYIALMSLLNCFCITV